MLPAHLESDLLQPGDVTVLAGRPGQGKTSLALQLAMKAAKRKDPALIFSLKTASARLMKRLLCLETHLPLTAAMSDQLEKADQKKARAVMKRLSGSGVHIDDSSASIEQIVRLSHRASEKAQAKRRKLGLIVIDYFQLLSEIVDGGAGNAKGVAKTLKTLAQELKVPVLVMSLVKRPADAVGVLERDIAKVVLTVQRRQGAAKRIRMHFDRITGELSKP